MVGGARNCQLRMDLPSRIQISMQNPRCSGSRLVSIVDWLHREGVRAIELQVADSLYRFNVCWQKGLSREDSLKYSLAYGERWLKENEACLIRCYNLFDTVYVYRWEYYKQNCIFEEIFRILRNIIENDAVFKCIVDDYISEFFKRSGKILSEESYNNSVNFILEEIAVSEYTARHSACNEIYPGARIWPESYLANERIYRSQFYLGSVNFIYFLEGRT